MNDVITKKIRDLLRLAEGNTNEAEATAAVAAANKLMAKYKIESLALELEEDVVVNDVDLYSVYDGTVRTFPKWQAVVMTALCKIHDVRAFKAMDHDNKGKPTTRINVVGRRDDATAVSLGFAYLTAALNSVAAAAALANDRPGVTWCFEFKYGCAIRIAERLEAEARMSAAALRQEQTTSALVRVDTNSEAIRKAQEAIISRMKTRRARYAPSDANAEARAAGYSAGAGVSLTGKVLGR